MPSSNYLSIPAVLHFATAFKPARVLDAGVGMGAYGLLLRQHLDIALERVERSEWKLQLDGIEIFEGYRNPVWGYVYDRVTMGDIRTIKLGHGYDLALCADVLEHMPREEARRVVDRLLEAATVVIITTPNVFLEQGAWGGNESERHHCLLSASDFPHLVASNKTGLTTCFVCCRDPKLALQLRRVARGCPTCNYPRALALIRKLKDAVWTSRP